MSAVGETTTARPSRDRVGMVCLVIAEGAMFTIFVIAYLFYVGKSTSGPTPRCPRRRRRIAQAIVPLDDKRQMVAMTGTLSTSRGVGPDVLLPRLYR